MSKTIVDPAFIPQARSSVAEFRQQFLQRSGAEGFSEGGGDHVLNDGIDRHPSQEFKDAAVLFGVIERPQGAQVLFTRRTETLSSHKGQIALPGGRIDADDPSPQFAALRETHEEVGIDPSYVTVLGSLGEYYSGSGYRVVPVVGIIKPDFQLALNEHEVAEAFEVPLSFLMDKANHQIGSAIWNDKERFFYKMPFGEGRNVKPIWGVTAGIVRMIYDRIYG